MRKTGTLRGFSGAIEFTQIVGTYLPIPLTTFGIDHVHDLGPNRSKVMNVI
jgi:hypothetical protein